MEGVLRDITECRKFGRRIARGGKCRVRPRIMQRKGMKTRKLSVPCKVGSKWYQIKALGVLSTWRLISGILNKKTPWIVITRSYRGIKLMELSLMDLGRSLDDWLRTNLKLDGRQFCFKSKNTKQMLSTLYMYVLRQAKKL